jgi:tetratricopeptide (TPR) repeat protein
MARGNGAEALRLHQEALDRRRAAFGEEHLRTASSWANVAEDHRLLGDLTAAQAAADTALRLQLLAIGHEHLAVARTLALHGNLARQRRDFEAADRHFGEAQAIRERLLPADHPLLARCLADRALGALASGRAAEAETWLREALRRLTAASAPATQTHAAVLQNLGVALASQGRAAEAEPFYRDALAQHRRRGDAVPAVADCLYNLARIRLQLGDPQGAVALHHEALELRRRHRPDEPGPLRGSLRALADACVAAGDAAGAARAEAELAELAAQDGSFPLQQVMATRASAARWFLDAGLPGDAEPLLASVRDWCHEHLPGQWPHGEALGLLAECRLAAGDAKAASALAERAMQVFADSPPPGDRLARTGSTLARARAAAATDDGDRRR